MERYKIEPSKKHANHWICTDTETLIVCEFENHKFNETQQFTFLDESKIDITKLATVMREFGYYLFRVHREKVF